MSLYDEMSNRQRNPKMGYFTVPKAKMGHFGVSSAIWDRVLVSYPLDAPFIFFLFEMVHFEVCGISESVHLIYLIQSHFGVHFVWYFWWVIKRWLIIIFSITSTWSRWWFNDVAFGRFEKRNGQTTWRNQPNKETYKLENERNQ